VDDRLIQVTKESMYSAGDILRQCFGKKQKISYKKDSSKVTEVDLICNRVIIERIKKDFPDHVIFTEESDGALTQTITQEPTWIIDPLDGTSNFISGIPLFGTMLAYVENETPIISAIYDPLHDELFLATKDHGATLNDEPMRVSKTSVTRGAMMLAGRGVKQADRDFHANIIKILERETTYFRRLGSAAFMLSSVAAGKADAVVLTAGRLWDVLPGAFLIEQAGGTITDFFGNPWNVHSHDLVGTNGLIHDQIIRITDPLTRSYDSDSSHQTIGTRKPPIVA
jgi:myo-inositol-1(or 4)-monophosphatase